MRDSLMFQHPISPTPYDCLLDPVTTAPYETRRPPLGFEER